MSAHPCQCLYYLQDILFTAEVWKSQRQAAIVLSPSLFLNVRLDIAHRDACIFALQNKEEMCTVIGC